MPSHSHAAQGSCEQLEQLSLLNPVFVCQLDGPAIGEMGLRRTNEGAPLGQVARACEAVAVIRPRPSDLACGLFPFGLKPVIQLCLRPVDRRVQLVEVKALIKLPLLGSLRRYPE